MYSYDMISSARLGKSSKRHLIIWSSLNLCPKTYLSAGLTWQIEASNQNGPVSEAIAKEGANLFGIHASQWQIKWLTQASLTTIQTRTMTKEAKTLGAQNVPGVIQIQSWAKQKWTIKQPQHHHAIISVTRSAMYVWSVALNLRKKPRASRRCVNFTGSRTKAQTCLVRLY